MASSLPIPVAPDTPLPVVGTLRQVVAEIVRSRVALLRALVVPAFLATFVQLGVLHWTWASYAEGQRVAQTRGGLLSLLVAVPVYMFVSVVVAVSCHRVILIGTEALPNRWGLFWSGREARFLARTLVLTMLTSVPHAAAFYFLWSMRVAPALHDDYMRALALLVAYPIARLSLVLPATATDQLITFGEAWRLSAGRGWRLVVLLGAGPLLLLGLSYLLGMLPLGEGDVSFVTRSMACMLLGAFEIVTLSVCFRALRPTS